jgi:ABC-type nitrate/sulfonate/bicarbonate transport system permease component
MKDLCRRPLRTAFPFLVLGGSYELFARSGLMKPVLTPSLVEVAATFTRLVVSGELLRHAGTTLARMLVGFTIAMLLGVTLGTLMARVRIVERLLAPIVGLLLPIPALAWVPVFIIWFGLGEVSTVLLVGFAATFPIIVNTRMGVMAISPIWIRAATVMEASRQTLFWKVILPGALPLILAGLRIGLARSWRAVIAGEMLAATAWGLGWAIFNAMEVLNTDIVLAVIVGIGLTGVLVESMLFTAIERRFLVRWGMVRETRR